MARALLDPSATVPCEISAGYGGVALRRFGVYRNNVVVSLIEAIKASYPIVCRLLGDEFFSATAREFVRARPPQSPILSRYGAGFAEFLEHFEPVADVPYLADVARLEWLQIRAYHSADAEPLDADAFQTVPASAIPDLRLGLHPSVGLFTSAFPAVSIWRTNAYDTCVQCVDLEVGGEDALVLRPHLDTLVLPLPPGGHCLIGALADGRTLRDAYAAASASTSTFDLQYALAALIDCGAIVALDRARDTTRGRISNRRTK